MEKNEVKSKIVETEIEPGVKKIIIMEGKENTPLVPVPLIISGNIDSPRLFLEKRKTLTDELNCHIVVMKESYSIILYVNPENPPLDKTIMGTMVVSELTDKIGINSGVTRTPHELADFLRMHRYMFSGSDVCNKLVSELRDFKAKVEKQCDTKRDDKANYNIIRSQVVTSNLPDKFTVNLEIFKGLPKVSVPIEIAITPDTLSCQLISPEFNEAKNELLENTIGAEIKSIKEQFASLLIIEA